MSHSIYFSNYRIPYHCSQQPFSSLHENRTFQPQIGRLTAEGVPSVRCKGLTSTVCTDLRQSKYLLLPVLVARRVPKLMAHFVVNICFFPCGRSAGRWPTDRTRLDLPADIRTLCEPLLVLRRRDQYCNLRFVIFRLQ